jgi:hypothetical protein
LKSTQKTNIMNEDTQKVEESKGFFSIFLDSNSWNEKTIIGFMAFSVMILFAFADLATGYLGKDLVISDTIYNSFLYITLGCFGIDGIQKFAGKKTNDNE